MNANLIESSSSINISIGDVSNGMNVDTIKSGGNASILSHGNLNNLTVDGYLKIGSFIKKFTVNNLYMNTNKSLESLYVYNYRSDFVLNNLYVNKVTGVNKVFTINLNNFDLKIPNSLKLDTDSEILYTINNSGNSIITGDIYLNSISKFERDATSKLYGTIYGGDKDYSSVGQNP